MSYLLTFWSQEVDYTDSEEVLSGPYLIESKQEGNKLGEEYMSLYHQLFRDKDIWFEVEELETIPTIESLNILIKQKQEQEEAIAIRKAESERRERELYLIKLNELKQLGIYEARTGHIAMTQQGINDDKHKYLIVRKSTPKIERATVTSSGCNLTLEPETSVNSSKYLVLGKGATEEEAWESISFTQLEEVLNSIKNYTLLV